MENAHGEIPISNYLLPGTRILEQLRLHLQICGSHALEFDLQGLQLCEMRETTVDENGKSELSGWIKTEMAKVGCEAQVIGELRDWVDLAEEIDISVLFCRRGCRRLTKE